jgi:hypothetical protein
MPNAAITTARAASEGFSPLDEQLQLWDADWSEVLAKRAVWLVGLMGDDLAEELFSKLGGIDISDTSIWRRVAKWGEKIKAVEAARAAQASALPERDTVMRGESRSGPRMGVAMDGTMLYIRREGFKELKVGCTFEVEKRLARDKETGEDVEVVRSVNNSYVAHLGGPERLGELLWADASRRGFARAIDTIALGDAAPWIWNQVRQHFGSSRQAVDWYHAKEHLYAVGHLAHGEGSAEAVRWAKGMETPLYEGHARRVAMVIEALAERRTGDVAKKLRTEAGYFERNCRRMQYMELREDGWPLGSGMIESGCKQFGARFDGPGMRWSRAGAERLLPIRAAIMSRRFDELWSAAYKLPPK